MIQKIKKFFEELNQELKKINWPTKTETIRYTLFVVIFSVIVAVFLDLFDVIFIRLLEKLLKI